MPDPSLALRIYLIAGEASGDLLGAHLMRSLKKQSSLPIQFYGIGGERMQAEGLTSLFPYSDLSLFGFFEILPQLAKITARINHTVDDIILKQPDAVITIDVPGFSLRVVKKARKHNKVSKFIHYVAPTVWAYNAWRAKTCAQLFDHMLTLLPFEAPFFQREGLPTTYVGHPVVVESAKGNGKRFREHYGIEDDTTLVCILPGSRKSEIERHLTIFTNAVTVLADKNFNLAMVVIVPPRMLPLVEPFFAEQQFPVIVVCDEQEKKDAIHASNVAIVKSGTVTFEVAMAGTPMVVSYKLNRLSAALLKRKLTIKFVTLINLLLGREAIPELLQEHCTPNLIAHAVEELLLNPERQIAQRNDIADALKLLTPAHGILPSDIAAEAILRCLYAPPSPSADPISK